jgi:Type II secretion system (T2SS), protein E, N-terminal domain
MPFLTKKTGAMKVSALMPSALRVGNGVAWQEDEYRPSNELAGLKEYGLPAPAGKTSQRRMCGNLECESGWTMPWRNRRRPIFEGQWGCSGRCVLAMVRAAVRRELGDGGTSAALSPHRHRVPLGLLMLAQGWITHPQLQKALAAQRESGTGKIGEWLLSECGVEAEQITRGLSMQWGCPVLTMEGFSPEAMSLAMPKVLVEKFGLLPLRVAGSRILYLGFADRLDASVAFATEQMTGLKVESGVVEGASFEAARRRLLACDGVETKLEAVEDKDAMAAKITAILEQKQPIASRLVRLHQYYWLRMWLESGALGKAGNLPVTNEDVKDHVFTVGAHESR